MSAAAEAPLPPPENPKMDIHKPKLRRADIDDQDGMGEEILMKPRKPNPRRVRRAVLEKWEHRRP